MTIRTGGAPTLTLADFVSKARQRHGSKYDYSESVYTKSREPITIRCPEHGAFTQSATSHLQGRGCPRCGLNTQKRKGRPPYTYAEARSRFVEAHGDSYDYSLVNYVDYRTKVQIRCLKCGLVFAQIPASHAAGHGCPGCRKRK